MGILTSNMVFCGTFSIFFEFHSGKEFACTGLKLISEKWL